MSKPVSLTFLAIGVPFGLAVWIILIATVSESLNTKFGVPPIASIIGVVIATLATYIVLATARR